MSELQNIRKLIESKKLKEADLEIKKLGSEYLKNPEYLILRAIMFKIQKNYYLSETFLYQRYRIDYHILSLKRHRY